MKEKQVVSVALDLGATSTGVFIVANKADEVVTQQNVNAFTVVNTDKLHFSTRNRTANRHRVRSLDRFNLARRLLYLIVSFKLKASGISLSDEQANAVKNSLSGFLKRRGYSRTETELDMTLLHGLDPAVFALAPGFCNFVNSSESVYDCWQKIEEDINLARALINDKDIPDAKNFVAWIKKEFPDYTDKTTLNNYKNARSLILEAANNLASFEALGHKHRSSYFEAIHFDIAKDSRLKIVAEAFGGFDRLWHLICNISNLQLRALRWYFNEKPKKDLPEVFNPQKFKEIFIKALKYFHPSPAFNQNELIKQVKNAPDILDFLCSSDPESTIPPYEDQNNRRPPVDETLLLNPKALTCRFGVAWTAWATTITTQYPIFGTGLEEILKNPDRKSRLQSTNKAEIGYQYAYILQRIFDASAGEFAELRLRKAVSSGDPLKTECARKLSDLLGSQHVSDFMSCARQYYDECLLAKTGLWSTENAILEKSGIHPPQKAKILKFLVAQILNIKVDDAQTFMNSLWHRKVQGNRTLLSICRSLEETRKSYGPRFAADYKKILQARKDNDKKKYTSEEELLVKAVKNVELASNFIQQELGIEKTAADRFSNPYSLSQLYNLLETERNGFTSCTLAAHLENTWRMSANEGNAICCRLPADCVRPFDGFIRKMIDRNSWEIAKRVCETIKSSCLEANTRVVVPILLESNSFSFTASLQDLKYIQTKETKFKASLDKANKGIAQQEKRWLSKEERIKADSCGTSAYSGEKIAGNGEIDHIIPRSLTTKFEESVLNSEFNLIYVSQKDNQRKSNQFFFLDNLASNYLQAVFNTTDLKTIESRIEKTVKELNTTGKIRFIELLTQEERNDVRHALFLPAANEARDIVLNVLGKRRSSAVNGTQAWFARCLQKKIETELADWLKTNNNSLSFRVFPVNAEDSSKTRRDLAKVDPFFAKKKIQPAASHTIDAMCVFANGIARPFFDDLIKNNDELVVSENLKNLYPQSCEFIANVPKPFSEKTTLSDVPIFKDSIYAEEFFTLIVGRQKLFIGFDTADFNESNPSKIEVTGKKPFELLNLLKDFLDKPIEKDTDKKTVYHITKNKAFELFTKASKSKVNEDELLVCDLLESLHYTTLRKTVSSAVPEFFSHKNESTLESVIKEKVSSKCKVTLKISAKRLFSATGYLVLPVAREWSKILHKVVSTCQKKGITAKNTAEIDKVISENWTVPARSRMHKKVKRVYSLPIAQTQSTAMRVKRKTLDGAALYQSLDANALYSSFPVDENNKIDWKNCIPHPCLQSEALTAYGTRYISSASSVNMTEWRKVYESDDVNIEMCPATKTRRYIRAEVPESMFKDCFKSEDGKDLESSFDLGSSLKLKDHKAFENNIYNSKKYAHLKVFLPAIRAGSAMTIEKVGSSVRFRYTAEGEATDLKPFYEIAPFKKTK